jgi:hypothetical protein
MLILSYVRTRRCGSATRPTRRFRARTGCTRQPNRSPWHIQFSFHSSIMPSMVILLLNTFHSLHLSQIPFGAAHPHPCTFHCQADFQKTSRSIPFVHRILPLMSCRTPIPIIILTCHTYQTFSHSFYVPPTRRARPESSAISDYAGDRADCGLGTHESMSCGEHALPIPSLHSSQSVCTTEVFLLSVAFSTDILHTGIDSSFGPICLFSAPFLTSHHYYNLVFLPSSFASTVLQEI